MGDENKKKVDIEQLKEDINGSGFSFLTQEKMQELLQSFDLESIVSQKGIISPIGILPCESGKPFAQKIYDQLSEKIEEQPRKYQGCRVEMIPVEYKQFANTESKPMIEKSIRVYDLYIVQDVENRTLEYEADKNKNDLMRMIAAARRSGCESINVVIPVFPDARQDKASAREPNSAAETAKNIEEAGAKRVLTLDIHNEAIEGFFRKAIMENLMASGKFIPYIAEKFDLENVVIGSPDLGGTKRAGYYSRKLFVPMIFFHKGRDKYAKIKEMKLVADEDITNKDVFIVDDMIATGGTMLKAAEIAKNAGAKDVYCVASLPLFNKDAFEKFDSAVKEGHIKGVITTDAVYHGTKKDVSEKYPWYNVLTIAGYFAEDILALNRKESLSEVYERRSKTKRATEMFKHRNSTTSD